MIEYPPTIGMMLPTARIRLLLLAAWLSQSAWAFSPHLPSRLGSRSQIHTATKSDVGEADVRSNQREELNFYEILGASPNASKMELKQSYIKMARVTHPDALIGVNKTDGDGTSTDFSDVAQAWKILSNEKERRRYDRSLVAEDFKKNVEKAASNVVETAGPRVKKAFDDFAMPFLRRTTVTTVATVSAAVDILGNGEKLNLGSAVASGMKAAQAAGRVVDGELKIEQERRKRNGDQLNNLPSESTPIDQGVASSVCESSGLATESARDFLAIGYSSPQLSAWTLQLQYPSYCCRR